MIVMRRLIGVAAALLLVGIVAVTGLYWFTFRIYVPENQCAVLVLKMGKELPSGQAIATKPGYKGIQEEVLGPGRYFKNPFWWKWELKPLTVIPAGRPETWEWTHSLNDRQRHSLAHDQNRRRHRVNLRPPPHRRGLRPQHRSDRTNC